MGVVVELVEVLYVVCTLHGQSAPTPTESVPQLTNPAASVSRVSQAPVPSQSLVVEAFVEKRLVEVAEVVVDLVNLTLGINCPSRAKAS